MTPAADRSPGLLAAPTDPVEIVVALEDRGRAKSQARLRRRFLRFAGIAAGHRVVEVGSGTGVVARDLAALVGPRGRVVAADVSGTLSAVARRLARCCAGRDHLDFLVADGARLPLGADRLDAAVAVTVLLHVEEPAALVAEMVRVTRPGGTVGAQDQDLGTLALAHPDRGLTARILDAVARSRYAEPLSGRRLPALFAAAGLRSVRLRTEVYQDTGLGSYARRFLEHRAASAVRLGVVDHAGAQRWLDGFVELARTGGFVMTMNYYGVTGVKP